MAFEDLISTKATGKAQTSSGPGQSNIAAQMAQGQANKQIAQQQEQGQIQDQAQDQQMAAVKQDGLDQQQALKTQELEQSAGNMEQVQGLLQKAEFSELELADRQDALSLESASHKLMMEDQSYVQQLREVGRRRRLHDAVSFNEELDRTVYGGELSMLMNELGWMEGQGKIGRERSEELYNMNADIAMAIAAADAEQANTEMIVQGGMNAATAAAGVDWSKGKGTPDVEITNTTERVDVNTRALPSNIA